MDVSLTKLAEARLVKGEALERRQNARTELSAANRIVGYIGESRGLSDEGKQQGCAVAYGRIHEATNSMEFAGWIIAECNVIIEAEIEKFREAYEGQKDSGE